MRLQLHYYCNVSIFIPPLSARYYVYISGYRGYRDESGTYTLCMQHTNAAQESSIRVKK